MVPAFGMVILPQNPITGNGQVPGWSCFLSVGTRGGGDRTAAALGVAQQCQPVPERRRRVLRAAAVGAVHTGTTRARAAAIARASRRTVAHTRAPRAVRTAGSVPARGAHAAAAGAASSQGGFAAHFPA